MKKCSRCKKLKSLIDFNGVRESVCRDCRRSYSREYYRKHKKYLQSCQRAQKNQRRKQMAAWRADPDRRAGYNLQAALREAVRAKRFSPRMRALVGCDYPELRDHLNSTCRYADFDLERDYRAKSRFMIDHIICKAMFRLRCKYHQKLCFHWSNLQILTREDNSLKLSVDRSNIRKQYLLQGFSGKR